MDHPNDPRSLPFHPCLYKKPYHRGPTLFSQQNQPNTQSLPRNKQARVGNAESRPPIVTEHTMNIYGESVTTPQLQHTPPGVCTHCTHTAFSRRRNNPTNIAMLKRFTLPQPRLRRNLNVAFVSSGIAQELNFHFVVLLSRI